MSKLFTTKRIVMVVTIVLFGVGLFLFMARPEKHLVNFTFTEGISDYTVKIYKTKLTSQETSVDSIITKSEFVQQISKPSSLQLTESKYLATIEGKELKNTVVEFKVMGTMDVSIVLEPTKEKLAAILSSETNIILSDLSKQQPLINQLGYSIIKGELFLDGTWYGALVIKNTALTGQQEGYSDIFRIILHKEKDVWMIKNKYPELVISTVKYPEIPRDVVSQVNQMKRE